MKIKKKIPVDLIERMNTLCDRLDLDSVSELINYINVNVTQPHDDYNELVMYSSSPTKIIQFECDDEVSQLIKEQTFPTWLFSQIVGTKYYSHFFKTLTKADYSSEICDELYKNLPGANYREEQKECILNLSQTLNENKIGFVEASTGTGKALASLIAAAEQVSLGNKPLLIATATRALLRQLDEKESPLIKASFEIVFKEKTLKVARLSGMNSYVSPQLLRDLIATDDITDNDKISAKKYIEMSEQNGQWLVEDLESLVSDEFPFDVVKITETVDEENAEPYLTAKENARSADIMIITHTLAIMDIMYDGKILNIQDQQQRHMIIDEGHLFEKSVSSAMSNQYHVASQLTACRQLIQSLKKCKKCDRYLSMLLLLSGELEASLKEGKNWYKGDSSSVVKSYGKEHDGIDSFNSMMKKLQAPYFNLFDKDNDEKNELMSLINKIKDKDISITKQNYYQLKNGYYLINRLTRNYNSADVVVMNYSPKLFYPSITVGNGYLSNLFKKVIWPRLSGCALLSATLYITDKAGNPDISYIKNSLCVDDDRLKTFQPLTADWLYKPECMVASSDCPKPVSNISDDHEQVEKYQNWIQWVKTQVSHVAKTAKGGVLVLFTAYNDIKSVSADLELPQDYELIMSSSGRSLSSYVKQFKAANGKALFLTTGAAWQGLDISKGNLLTDLVIVKIPFGQTKNPSAFIRRMKCGKGTYRSYDVPEAILTLKQGMGRLMRRPDSEDRRLIILDSRLLSGNHDERFRQLIAPYKNQTIIEEEHG